MSFEVNGNFANKIYTKRPAFGVRIASQSLLHFAAGPGMKFTARSQTLWEEGGSGLWLRKCIGESAMIYTIRLTSLSH